MASLTKADQFRATSVWKEAVTCFKSKMPTKKHRKGFKSYDNCFSGEEAVNWFLKELQNSPTFGTNVTWEQTQLLLEKFFLAGVFTSCGDDGGRFKPNNSLYKFSTRAPLKTIHLPMYNVATGTLGQQTPVDIKTKVRMKKEMERNTAERAARVRDETVTRRDTWKDVVYSRLQQLLDGVDLSVLLPTYEINGYYIVENAVSPHYYTFREELDHSNLKSWLIGAMKTLVEDKGDSSKFTSHMATYTAFQQDVFSEIASHFKGQPPLIPTELSKAILGSFEYFQNENILDLHSELDQSYVVSSKSTEELLLNMTTAIWSIQNWNPFVSKTEEVCSANTSACAQEEHQIWQEHVCEPKAATPSASCGDKEYRTPAFKVGTLVNSDASPQEHHNEHPKKASLNPFKTDTGEWIQYMDASAEKVPGDFCWESLLPANCCFETEFVTENPVTRVIPRPGLDKKHVAHRPTTPFTTKQQQILSPGEILLPYHSQTPSTFSGMSNHSSSHVHSDHENEPRNENLNFEATTASFTPRPTESLIRKQKRKSRKSKLTDIFTLVTTPITKVKSYTALETTFMQTDMNDMDYDDTMSLLDVACINNVAGDYQESFHPSTMPNPTKPDDKEMKGLNVDLALESVMKLVACSLDTPSPPTKPHYSTPETSADMSRLLTWGVSKLDNNPDNLGKMEESPELFNPGCGRNNVKFTSDVNLAVSPRDTEEWAKLNFDSSENLTSEDSFHRVEILNLLLLTLPPANRARLSLLLSFMNHIIYKEDFVLHPILSNVTMVINAFKSSILSYNEADETIELNPTLPHDVVKFLLEHRDALFIVPADLMEEVQQSMTEMQHSKMESAEKRNQLKSQQANPVTYCEQVTTQEFEKQKLRDSELALFELLEQIAEDCNMPYKEKKQRLKAFSDSYPHLYKKRFPTEEEEQKVLRPANKRKSILTKIYTLRF